jgi:aryl-alcohol dehydrogenase-like predicted oxidoreductase
MEYRTLGRSGIKVSPLCLGTMMFGGPTDEPTATRIIARAREQGVNFIDTANVYQSGRSEEIVGRAIAAHRGEWVLATKVATPTGTLPNQGGLTRPYVFRCVEASLRRLGTDTIDVLYLHKEDHATPLDAVVHTFADLIHQGKIRHFGVSNHRAWRVAEICRLCDSAGIDRPVVSQPYYSAIDRTAEVEHLPACAHFGLSVFPYSPLARGVLTGKYTANVAPEEGSRAARRDRRLLETAWDPENLRVAAEIAARAADRGMAPGAFAIAWVLNNRLITGIVAGPRTEAQWDAYAAALDCRLDTEDEAVIDRLVSPGHAAVPGFNDPAYPIEGRVPRTR